jgi:hypothetical protein
LAWPLIIIKEGNLMKVSMLLSAAVTACAWVSQATAAIIPESTSDIRTCQAWAETYKGTVNHEPATTRCEAIQECKDYQSANEIELRQCLFTAESNFSRAFSGTQSQVVEASSGVNSPVSTIAPRSDYELRRGKGFPGADADQGD